MRAAAAGLLLLSAACGGPTLVAAASLGDVVPAVLRRTGDEPRASFAATSMLARQIEQGLEADVFLAADREWVDYLIGRGFGVEVRELARNALVACAREGTPGILGPADLARAERIAVGAESVPVGRYARRALAGLGLEDRFLSCRDARAVIATLLAGEADVAIAYATDARELREVHRFERPRVRYWALLLREGPEARALFDRLTGKEAAGVFVEHGFVAAR